MKSSQEKRVSDVIFANQAIVRPPFHLYNNCVRIEIYQKTDAQCEFMKFAAALGRDGTLQGYYTLPADLYVPIAQLANSAILSI